VLAAVTTTALLSAPTVVGRAAELPDGWLEADAPRSPVAGIGTSWLDATEPGLVGPRPSVIARSAVGAGAAVVVAELADEDEGGGAPGDADDAHVGSGALPDGVVELARHDGVVVATEGAHVELVGFHESSSGAALPMDPVGPDVSAHPVAAAAAPADEGPVIVLPPRGRAGAATSAIDLSVTAGEPVVAPITGEVEEVAEYALYGTTRDQLVRIRSSEDPTVVAHVHHVDDASVAVGDTVEAGTSVIAGRARQLPFESQIDRFTAAHRGEATPHVHIELRIA
jgi:hypothetical protein